MATNILPSQIQSAGLDQNQVLAWNGSAFAAAITIAVGNSTVNTSINATSFSGTANNANNLGGTSLATLQGQITGNAATAYTNATSYADNKAANAYSNAISYANTAAANAYSNAITYSANASNLGNGTVAPARLGSGTANSTTILYGNGVFAPAPDSTNASSLTTGTINVSLLASYGTANSTTVLYGNSVWGPAPSSTNASALISGTVNTSLLGSGTANSTTILYGNGVFAAAPDGVNTAFQYTFTNTISFSSNVSLVSGNGTNQLLIGTINATSIGLLANSTTLTVGNSSVNTVVNATSFSGTANNANNLGGTSLATLQNQITGNAATAYSNGTSYTDIKAGNAYSNAASYADTVAANAYSNAISYANTVASNAYSNATSYADTKAANAYSNGTSYADIKAGNAYSNATSYVTAGGYTVVGDVTFSGNVFVNGTTFNANVTNLNVKDLNILVGDGAASNASSDGAGLIVSTPNAQLFYSGGSNTWNTNRTFTPSSNVTFDLGSTILTWSNVFANQVYGTLMTSLQPNITANNANNLGGTSLATLQGEITGNAATAYSNGTSYADNKAANAYSNAIAYSANADNISSGTVAPARLGSGTANSTTILYGNGVFAPAADGVNTAFQYTFTNAISFGSNVSITLGLLNGTVGATAPNTGAFTTLSTSGIITASTVGNIIPFYYSNQAGFPSATTYHGALAHSHSDGAMYFAHSSAWTRLLDTAGGYTVTGTATYSGNIVLTSGNGTNQLLLGTINATSIGMLANSTVLTVGNSTVNTTISAANTTLYTPTMRGSRETVLANTAAAGAMTLDLSYGIHRWNVTGNITSINFTNVPANNTVFNGMLYVTANATGTNSTNRAITFPSTANATTGKALFSGGVAPPATSSNGSLDIYSFTTIDGGNNYVWSLSVKDAR